MREGGRGGQEGWRVGGTVRESGHAYCDPSVDLHVNQNRMNKAGGRKRT